MPIKLNKKEEQIKRKLKEIKKTSGSHSPSPIMLNSISDFKIKHDFCYLANVYATDLFFQYFQKDSRKEEFLRQTIEWYPSQGSALSEKLSSVLKIPAKNIFIGNGASEIIQAVIQNFVKSKILIPIPTFSSYIEFAPKNVSIVYHKLTKESGFKLNVKNFLSDVRKENPDTVVLINPNNPEGGYLNQKELGEMLLGLKYVPTVILDESFIHFAEKNPKIIYGSAQLIKKFPNLIIIKSLSKDFGIAGIRLGYAVMEKSRVSTLFERGYLWNVSGLGEYFLGLLEKKDFRKKYEITRQKAIADRDIFFKELSKIQGIKIYPSKGNFFLVEIINGSKVEDVVVLLLARFGIYVRSCKDKVGLTGEFIRIASRKQNENNLLLKALASIL